MLYARLFSAISLNFFEKAWDDFFNKPITQPLHNKQKTGMGEWLFKDEYDYKPIKLVGDYTSYIKPEINNVIPDDYIIQSLTQNAY